jgi:hypothetical protein
MRLLFGLLLVMLLAGCATPDEYAATEHSNGGYVPFWNGHHWDWYQP